MSGIATTLRSQLEYADGLWREGRYTAALAAFESLLQRAQERTDRPTEVVSRSMIAMCCLRKRDLDGAQLQLQRASHYVDPEQLESYSRYRSALCRLALEQNAGEAAHHELLDYLEWAEHRDVFSSILDACLLLGRISKPEDRIQWLQRGIDQASRGRVERDLGQAYMELAACLDQLERVEEALEAYEKSLGFHEKHGKPRDIVSATWAVGSVCVRLEDWPKAQETLERGQRYCRTAEGCDDLLALITADLAHAYEASGDVIEARRQVIAAIRIAREQSLDGLWPQRWRALRAHAQSLEVDI